MDIEGAVEEFIVTEIMLADNSIKLDSKESLISTGVLDSLALLRLIAFIEDQFNINVEDTEVIPENLETIHDIVTFIEMKKQSD